MIIAGIPNGMPPFKWPNVRPFPRCLTNAFFSSLPTANPPMAPHCASPSALLSLQAATQVNDKVYDVDSNVHILKNRVIPRHGRAAAEHAVATAGALFHSNEGIDGGTAHGVLDASARAAAVHANGAAGADGKHASGSLKPALKNTAAAVATNSNAAPLKLFIMCLSSQTERSKIARGLVYVDSNTIDDSSVTPLVTRALRACVRRQYRWWRGGTSGAVSFQTRLVSLAV